jgi:hypothetical protein
MYAVTIEIKAGGMRRIEIHLTHFKNVLAAALRTDYSSSDRNRHVYKKRLSGSRKIRLRREKSMMK